MAFLFARVDAVPRESPRTHVRRHAGPEFCGRTLGSERGWAGCGITTYAPQSGWGEGETGGRGRIVSGGGARWCIAIASRFCGAAQDLARLLTVVPLTVRPPLSPGRGDPFFFSCAGEVPNFGGGR